ncbi:hypothetical protein NIES4072_57340 [Nostoc commune NIES-4072]|uniref:Uncharacterized protein n=1 Tax=Nostoc commune NIES-4072 TaxID=2005467 RepID=A0A2R5FX43_NOSCO|nr:hypothetical protein NIES4070_33590 [Nostoc commune HK-02]GBG22028.1 hypothetical protein NIES4072_57340 [Nostoc commune NIES-4072]
MKKLKAAVVALVPGIIFVPWTSPALAHDVRYPSNNGYGQVRDNHEIVDACDTNRNGKGFYVLYSLRSGARGRVGDGNGADAGCGIARVGSPQNPVVRFTVCQDFTGCSPWRDA